MLSCSLKYAHPQKNLQTIKKKKWLPQPLFPFQSMWLLLSPDQPRAATSGVTFPTATPRQGITRCCEHCESWGTHRFSSIYSPTPHKKQSAGVARNTEGVRGRDGAGRRGQRGRTLLGQTEKGEEGKAAAPPFGPERRRKAYPHGGRAADRLPERLRGGFFSVLVTPEGSGQ